jgi:hypothetical protein
VRAKKARGEIEEEQPDEKEELESLLVYQRLDTIETIGKTELRNSVQDSKQNTDLKPT